MAAAQAMKLRFRDRPVQLLVFDMDGVLVSTSACHAQAYASLWRRLGVDAPDYDVIAGRKTREVVAEFTAALAPGAPQLDEWTRYKQQLARDCIASAELCYPDTAHCLRRLAACGVPLALGTAASATTAAQILQRYQLQDCFDTVVTADDVRHGKPAPDVYLDLIRRHRVEPAATLVVEDSVPGLQAALAAGACAVSVRTGVRVAHSAFLGDYTDLTALQADFGGCP